jgi:kinesin family member 2/24
MPLSQKQLSTCISEIPQLLHDWERSYVTLSTDKRDNTGTTISASRDVVVAFRTRPVLPTELSTVSSHLENDKTDNGTGSDDLVQSSPCLGISVKQVEPGITVVHVPSMKVRSNNKLHVSSPI